MKFTWGLFICAIGKLRRVGRCLARTKQRFVLRFVEKEVWEESGFYTKAVKLLALYDLEKQGHPPHAYHIYRACFLCEITGGEAKTGIETTEVAFFGRDKIPLELSFPRVTHKQIGRFFDHKAHPEWPTDFD